LSFLVFVGEFHPSATLAEAPASDLETMSGSARKARVKADGSTLADRRTRLKLVMRGAVQGVGFRPFVFRLASELGLCGWVNNSPQGVFIEVEGPRTELEKFLLRLEIEKPPRCFIQSLEATWLDAVGYADFEIRKSEIGGSKTALVLPDIATCPDCLREIFEPTNRRFHYPFTNCTNCGPRFSIIESLPYDRASTSMKSFAMCPQCQAEYDDPTNRRFHAQPNACSVCGPRLEFWQSGTDFQPVSNLKNGGRRDGCPTNNKALLAAADAIRHGQIVAVKGIGGFHLMVAAHDEAAIRRLRERKQREEKPLAVMFPSLESVNAVCEVSPLEERLLRSPEAPIVLLRRLVRPHPVPLPQERENHPPALREDATGVSSIRAVQIETGECCSLSPGERVRVRASVKQSSFQITPFVAPGNPHLGAMLPYTPLHHLLLAELGFPVVATSGNLSDEPICTDEHEALERLSGIADVYLVHNRPIVRHVDDSIVRVMLDREMVLRRARGYAPLPIHLSVAADVRRLTSKKQIQSEPPHVVSYKSVLAVGAHLKNSVALAVGNQVFISQHIGDLETEAANNAFRRVITDFEKLYDAKPDIVASDLHPDYLSTKFAKEMIWSAPAERSDDGALESSDSTARPVKAVSRFACHRTPKHVGVQHHVAHVLSCMAENEIEPPVLGMAWDGTGYGLDGTIWGGEFFLVTNEKIERVAHLRTFRLPGGDKAVKEPRRAAAGLLYEMYGGSAFDKKELPPIAAFSSVELSAVKTMLTRELNSPFCCSVGRLFDAVASLVNLRQQIRYEGQAAMELEFALEGIETDEHYDLSLVTRHTPLILDWSPMIETILADVKNGMSAGEISAKFHNALVEAIVEIVARAGQTRVVLSGGCFQNRYLTERTVQRLREEGFQPYWHQRVPTNDGGIALGQIVAARRELR
jgi:hydrogenase maturation protein HypF